MDPRAELGPLGSLGATGRGATYRAKSPAPPSSGAVRPWGPAQGAQWPELSPWLPCGYVFIILCIQIFPSKVQGYVYYNKYRLMTQCAFKDH